MNWRLLNIHDVVLIVAVTAIFHMLARPFYNRLDGKSDNN